MGDRGFLERVVRGFDLDAEPLPGQTLLELVGDRRVLIENHCGVSEYANTKICVRVKKGQICVCGKGLNLALMSRERLIICGCIESVHLMQGR